MIRIKLTSSQRAAVLTYICEEIHREDYTEAHLSGGTTTGVLELSCSRERAMEILVNACNSADDCDSLCTDRNDPGSYRALSGIAGKLRRGEYCTCEQAADARGGYYPNGACQTHGKSHSGGMAGHAEEES